MVGGNNKMEAMGHFGGSYENNRLLRYNNEGILMYELRWYRVNNVLRQGRFYIL